MTSHGNCHKCGCETGVYDSAKKRWDCGCEFDAVILDEATPIRPRTIERQSPVHVRDIRAKRDALIHEARYSPCGCGSGKKAKFCCWDRLVQEARAK